MQVASVSPPGTHTAGGVFSCHAKAFQRDVRRIFFVMSAAWLIGTVLLTRAFHQSRKHYMSELTLS